MKEKEIGNILEEERKEMENSAGRLDKRLRRIANSNEVKFGGKRKVVKKEANVGLKNEVRLHGINEWQGKENKREGSLKGKT